jgi:ATP-dependent DNA helicase RecQ
MAFLTRLLDDPETGPCGVCDVCAGSHFDAPIDPADVEGAASFLRGRPLDIEPRRLWPAGLAVVRGAIKPAERLEDGRSLCRWGDGGWARDVQQGKEVASRFDEGLVAGLATMVRRWEPQPAPTWVTCVPSRRSEQLVPDLAGRVAGELGLPFLEVVAPIGSPAPQSTMRNSAQQVRNVIDSFRVVNDVPSGPVLLVDDIVDSRWTLTVVGRLLRLAGSGPVFPVALAGAAG